jgi:hypothetical protein
MFQKLSNSWELVKASAHVLRSDKELLIFPILSTTGVIIATAIFIFPFLVSNLADTLFSEQSQVFGTLIAFLYYIVQYTIIFFANTALVGAAMIRLRGGDPTVEDGLRIATKNFGSILGYALIAATVGMLLRWVSERSKGLGRFVISLIGMAWNIGTYLVVPILAVEGVGPIEAIKGSVNYLKKTWGEQIAGNMGIGAVTGLAFLIVTLIGGGFIGLVFVLELPLFFAIAAGALLVLALVFLGLISSALSGIYTAAVYQYAATGETGQFFETEIIENAFKIKA